MSIDFRATATALLESYNRLSADERDDLPNYLDRDDMPLTAYDDGQVALGHHDFGTWCTTQNTSIDTVQKAIEATYEVAQDGLRDTLAD